MLLNLPNLSPFLDLYSHKLFSQNLLLKEKIKEGEIELRHKEYCDYTNQQTAVDWANLTTQGNNSITNYMSKKRRWEARWNSYAKTL